MNILALSPDPDLPESYLLNGLASRGFNIHWMGDPEAKRRSIVLGNSNIKFSPIKFSSRFSVSAIRAIREAIRTEKISVVHSFTARALSNALIAGIGLNVRHVAYRGTVGNLSKLDPTSWLSFLHPSIAAISCVSEAVRKYLLKQGIHPEKAVTIYKGHNLSWYESITPTSLISLGIPDGAFVIGCTANMRPLKGVDVLIRAMHHLLDIKNLHLLLIGEVRDEAVAREASNPKVADRVHLAGFRPEPGSLVASCNIIAMPSKEREGLPKGVIEGMALGKAAVVTRAGGMPELVQDGVSGYVVPPSDEKALADAIRKLALSPEQTKKMGAAAKDRIRTAFNIESTISATEKVYKAVLRK